MDSLQHRCLLCGKLFFTAWSLFQHLQHHNFCQLDTHLCLYRLQLPCSAACQFCGQAEHVSQFSGKCLPLFHLAVFLTNGSPQWPGAGARYLEKPADRSPDDRTWHCGSRRSSGQTPQAKQTTEEEDTGRQLHGTLASSSGQIGPADGSLHQDAPPGLSVCPPSGARTGVINSDPTSEVATVASGRSNGPSSTLAGQTDVTDFARSPRCSEQDPSIRRYAKGVPGDGPHQQPGHAPLPSMGSSDQEAQGIQGDSTLFARDHESRAEYPSTCSGSQDDQQIPCPDDDGQQRRSIHSLVVDRDLPSQRGNVVRTEAPMLAQYLASYSRSNQTSNLGSVTPGEGHREGLEWHSVRILINPSNSCYVNACILCLAWITLIMDALSPSFWPLGGFELFRNVTATCWAPLTVVTFQPFLWLVSQGWTVGALDIQHDVADFCHWLLQRLCPRQTGLRGTCAGYLHPK